MICWGQVFLLEQLIKSNMLTILNGTNLYLLIHLWMGWLYCKYIRGGWGGFYINVECSIVCSIVGLKGMGWENRGGDIYNISVYV